MSLALGNETLVDSLCGFCVFTLLVVSAGLCPAGFYSIDPTRIIILATTTSTGPWYQQSGLGKGLTLLIASKKAAYVLTDEATCLSLGKRLNLKTLLRGDPKLFNLYSVILVNPRKSGRINAVGARALYDFLFSTKGRTLIQTFGREKTVSPSSI